MHMTERNESHGKDWLIFGVSAVLTVGLLFIAPAWFWVPLPFMLTYLTKALNAI